MTAAIEVQGLVKRYNETTALAGIDFSVDEGTVLGLLGPNGAGKTTAVRVLSTLIKADEGRASVFGMDVVADADAVRSTIGLTGQYAAVDEYLTGFENLEMVGRLYQLGKAESRARARALLERFDLAHAGNRIAKTYSGGMRRRLDVAASLIAQPRVLFLDEPTIGLDVTMQKRIRGFLAEHNRRHGSTILLTSHYMADVQALCERVVVIHEGTVRHDGPLDALAASFSLHQTLTFTLPDPAFDPAGVGEVVEVVGGRATVRVRRQEASQVAARLLADHGVADLTIQDPPIDDVIEQVFASHDTATDIPADTATTGADAT